MRAGGGWGCGDMEKRSAGEGELVLSDELSSEQFIN